MLPQLADDARCLPPSPSAARQLLTCRYPCVPPCSEQQDRKILEEAATRLKQLEAGDLRQIAEELTGQDPYLYLRAISPGTPGAAYWAIQSQTLHRLTSAGTCEVFSTRAEASVMSVQCAFHASTVPGACRW